MSAADDAVHEVAISARRPYRVRHRRVAVVEWRATIVAESAEEAFRLAAQMMDAPGSYMDETIVEILESTPPTAEEVTDPVVVAAFRRSHT